MKKLVLALVCGTFAAVSFGTVHYVSPDGAGTKDGSSPENARAWTGLATDKTPTFLAKGDTLKLVDGEYPVRTMRMTDTARDEITVEGNVEHPENVVINGAGVLYYFKCAGQFTIQGIKFTGGGSGNTVLSVYESTPNVTIRHCIFTDQTSSCRAVTVQKTGMKAVIEDCIVSDWVSDYGAFGCDNNCSDANLTVRRCTFVNCSAQMSSAVRKVKVLADCLITNCWSTANNGGALYRFAPDALITNCVFVDCSAGAKYGGTIQVADNPVTIVDSKFIRCSASMGGAIYSDGFAVTCRNCLFDAGSIINAGAMGGSALRIKAANTNDNCTFVNNIGLAASVNHASIYNDRTPVIRNCIFWNNLDKEGGTLRATSSHNSSTVNCAADLALGGTKSAFLTASPFVDAENGDYSLAKKVAGEPNPCLGAGVKLDWMTADTLDLAGHPRLRGDDIVDLGCYEYFSKSGLMLLVR